MESDDRPYWQRQGRTLQGWINHRAAVQRWKKRNPERNRAHANATRRRQIALYGRETGANDDAWLIRASKWNEDNL